MPPRAAGTHASREKWRKRLGREMCIPLLGGRRGGGEDEKGRKERERRWKKMAKDAIDETQNEEGETE